jgi:hypothetical protein
MVVTQNAGANKVDYYLRRELHTSLQLDPEPSSRFARVRGTIDVVLANTAPATGLPRSVIGPAEGLESRFRAGENYSLVSVYTPYVVRAAKLDGQPVQVEGTRELGRNVFSAWIDVDAQQTKTLSLDVEGVVRLGPGGWYDLQLVRQPFLTADGVKVELTAPEGWTVEGTSDLRSTADGAARGEYLLAENKEVRVRIKSGDGLGLWERLEHGS